MLKPQKNKNKITLKEVQMPDHEMLNRSVNNPCYFYNTYVRKEGEKVLSEDEFKEYQKREVARRNNIKPKAEPEFEIVDEGDCLSKSEVEQIREELKNLNKDEGAE